MTDTEEEKRKEDSIAYIRMIEDLQEEQRRRDQEQMLMMITIMTANLAD